MQKSHSTTVYTEGLDLYDRTAIALAKLMESFYDNKRLPFTEHLTGDCQQFAISVQDQDYPVRCIKTPLSSAFKSSNHATDYILIWITENDNQKKLNINYFNSNDLPDDPSLEKLLDTQITTADASFDFSEGHVITSLEGLNFFDLTSLTMIHSAGFVMESGDPIDFCSLCFCDASACPVRLDMDFQSNLKRLEITG